MTKKYVKKLKLRKEVKQFIKDMLIQLFLLFGFGLSMLLLMWIENLTF